MGKRGLSRRKGKGSAAFRAHSHKWLADVKYPVLKAGEGRAGRVVNIVHDPGRPAPLAVIDFLGNKEYFLATEGLAVGDTVQQGEGAVAKPGNVLQLQNISEGTSVCNIERRPDDGGRFARTAGSFAVVVSKADGRVVVMLPSKTMVDLDGRCRATVGVVAGGERKAKPLVKAGASHWLYKSRGARWPRVSARSMNVLDHKFGGSHLGVPKSVSRNAPPGRKVGSIASRRTGKRKK